MSSNHRNRVVTLVATAVSFIFVTFLIVGTSRAAFSDTTANDNNTVGSAGVVLTDDDSGSAMFTVADMSPDDTIVRCIEVTYDGTITTNDPIQLYRTAAPTGTGLEAYLDMTVEIGTGGGSAACTGFTPSSTLTSGSLAAFFSTHTAYASALSTAWTPTGAGQKRTFRFTLTMQDDNAAQAKNTTFGYTWEARA